MDGILEAHPATIGLADGTSSELPACRLQRVTQYIQENLQRELRLAELSALVHMSPYHFARLFRRSTGVPPHKFVVRRRIDEAQALLAARTAPIAEISQLVGFRTPSHFTTTFRRITGTTPGAYRSSGARAAPPAFARRQRNDDNVFEVDIRRRDGRPGQFHDARS
jgi:AraC family transcriptional regulator